MWKVPTIKQKSGEEPGVLLKKQRVIIKPLKPDELLNLSKQWLPKIPKGSRTPEVLAFVKKCLEEAQGADLSLEIALAFKNMLFRELPLVLEQARIPGNICLIIQEKILSANIASILEHYNDPDIQAYMFVWAKVHLKQEIIAYL
ncbi:hypothetical protein VKT23_001531 [Stygiomarasmius scandens]|uniref:Uncharacterized protein n=1 Tax=Marasmiellus scandens TaxID=2682957 RepID=A0ABR1K199_9AGAR